MPWHTVYTLDSAEIAYFGDTTGYDILSAKAQFFSHSFEREPRYVLCDFSAVRTFDISPGDVRQIVEQDRAAADKHPLLMEAVVAPTPISYGMSRMWESLVADVRPLTVVRPTRAEAIAWLAEQAVDLAPEHRREHAGRAAEG